MSRYTAAVDVPLPIDQAFELWTDAARFPQWQAAVQRVYEPSGAPREVGTTFRLDMGAGMTRTASILDSEPPVRHVVRQTGMGSTDETTAAFTSVGPDRTKIEAEVDLVVGLGSLGRVLERLTHGQTAKQLRTELSRFLAVAAREMPDMSPGSLVTVDCGDGYRVAKIIELEPDRVHLALMAGVSSARPKEARTFLDNESRLPDPLALKPLRVSLRRAASTVLRGQPLLGLDGGVGVPHLALTRGAFVDSAPQVATVSHVVPDESDEVASWRAAAGPTLGDDLDATVVPIVSIRDEDGYKVAKVLRVDRMAVHLRMYSDRWAIPPETLDPWLLRLDRYDAAAPGIGHIPVSHTSFASMAPAFERLTMVGTDELGGYRDWAASGGGVFG